VFVRKNGETHYLWRTIDHEGEVLEAFVAKRRDRKAALKFLKRTMKRFGAPKVIVTDRLRSYRAGHCQTNSQCLRERPGSQTSGRELAPFGQSGSAVMFKNITAVQMALLVEKVMDRGMDGGEFLEGADAPEP
jgi:transposase-like protein